MNNTYQGRTRKKRFLITGASLYGNLGSAAMILVLVEQLKVLFPDCTMTLASKYPENDKEEVKKYNSIFPHLIIVSTKQITATFIWLPLAMIYAVFLKFGLTLRFIENLNGLNAFMNADYVLDIGGITFSEERGLSVYVINTTWVLIPSLLGLPVIKLSQAIGPLNKSCYIVFSRIILNRVNLIISRGRLSSLELKKLNLRRACKQCSDLAFLLKPERTDQNKKFLKNGLTIAITPSSVVYQKIGPQKYVVLFLELINDLIKNYPECNIRLIAHSYKQGATLNNNDYPVCKAIYEGLSDALRDKTTMIFGDYSATEMKYIVGQSDVLIASRFHSMVGALSMGVPTVVLGWSHKYHEILELFNLHTAVNYRNFEYNKLWGTVNEMLVNNEAYKLQVERGVIGCKNSAMENFVLLKEFIVNYETN